MESKFIFLIIILMGFKNYSQNKEIHLSEIKFCEFKIAEFNDNKQIEVSELDDCEDGVSGLKTPGYERNIGYISSKFNGIIFQNHSADSTVSKITLTKDFKGFLPDGMYIDMSNLKARDILNVDTNKHWLSNPCTEYLQIKYKNISFYIKYDKSIKPRHPINQKLYSEKEIEAITIEVNCFNEKKNR